MGEEAGRGLSVGRRAPVHQERIQGFDDSVVLSDAGPARGAKAATLVIQQTKKPLPGSGFFTPVYGTQRTARRPPKRAHRYLSRENPDPSVQYQCTLENHLTN
ncbi:hypothetical protein PSAC2689_40456 [Paraburkholderia sacchari]